MTIQQIQNGILYGVSGDTKPTNYPTNTVFLEQDTGNVYIYNGSSWDLADGASSIETLSNKTIDAESQTDINKTVTADFLRETGMLTVAPLGVSSWGWLLGLTYLGASNAVQAVDSTHGLSQLFTSAAVANSSQAGNKTQAAFTYRAWNPYFRLKCSLGSVSSASRYFFGFTSNTITPTSDTFLSTTDSGVGIGSRTVDSNFFVYNNDGGGGAMATTDTGLARDTAVNSFEITFDNSIPNCVVKMNGTTVATITTKIPASGTALTLYWFVEPTSAIARTLKFYNAWFEHKRTVTPL